jgi:hypothetical protein
MMMSKELREARLDLKMANLSRCDACDGYEGCMCECETLDEWREEALRNLVREEEKWKRPYRTSKTGEK